MTAIVTAYCHCAACCGVAEGLTASDVLPISGITVAAPRAVPFGTRVRITLKDGRTWTLTAQDRIHGRYDGRWDIFMASHAEAVAFGIHSARVEILGRPTAGGRVSRVGDSVPSTAGESPALPANLGSENRCGQTTGRAALRPTPRSTQPARRAHRPATVASRGQMVGSPERQPGSPFTFPRPATGVVGTSAGTGQLRNRPVTLRNPARPYTPASTVTVRPHSTRRQDTRPGVKN